MKRLLMNLFAVSLFLVPFAAGSGSPPPPAPPEPAKRAPYLDDSALILDNGEVRAVILPRRDGRLIGFGPSRGYVNQLRVYPDRFTVSGFARDVGGIWEIPDPGAGAYPLQPVSFTGGRKDKYGFPGATLEGELWGFHLQKDFILPGGLPCLEVSCTYTNTDDSARPLPPRIHVPLAPGGSAGPEDLLLVPDGKTIAAVSGGDAATVSFEAGWACVIDPETRAAVLLTALPSSVGSAQVQSGGDPLRTDPVCAIDLLLPEQEVEPGGSVTVRYRLYHVRGKIPAPEDLALLPERSRGECAAFLSAILNDIGSAGRLAGMKNLIVDDWFISIGPTESDVRQPGDLVVSAIMWGLRTPSAIVFTASIAPREGGPAFQEDPSSLRLPRKGAGAAHGESNIRLLPTLNDGLYTLRLRGRIGRIPFDLAWPIELRGHHIQKMREARKDVETAAAALRGKNAPDGDLAAKLRRLETEVRVGLSLGFLRRARREEPSFIDYHENDLAFARRILEGAEILAAKGDPVLSPPDAGKLWETRGERIAGPGRLTENRTLYYAGLPIAFLRQEKFADEASADSRLEEILLDATAAGGETTPLAVKPGEKKAILYRDPDTGTWVGVTRGPSCWELWGAAGSIRSVLRRKLADGKPIESDDIKRMQWTLSSPVKANRINRLTAFPYAEADLVFSKELRSVAESLRKALAIGSVPEEEADDEKKRPVVLLIDRGADEDFSEYGLSPKDALGKGPSVLYIWKEGRRMIAVSGDTAEETSRSADALLLLVNTLKENHVFIGDLAAKTADSAERVVPDPVTTARGLIRNQNDFAAIVDRGSLAGAQAAADWAAQSGIPFPILSGQETGLPGLPTVLGLSKALPAPDPETFLKSARAAGGILCLADPDPENPWPARILGNWRAEGIQVMRIHPAVIDRIPEWTTRANLPSLVAGTGSVSGVFGEPKRTLVFTPDGSPESILRAIRSGRCVAYAYGEFYGPPDLVLLAQMLFDEGTFLKAQHDKRFKKRMEALP